ncbi:tyrosine-type recombinase/integrase [Planktomarina temperata]|nr:tyrosine-type recombinase/integrase [Planktomarina temperata]
MQTISIPYTFNRDGHYYFTRRVPKDLAHHYSRVRIVECLRTTSARQAKMQAQQANAKLEAYWASLRVVHAIIPGSATCLMSPGTPASGAETKRNDHQPDLRQALQLYLDLKGKNRPKSFEAAATRTCNYLIGIASNKSLGDYTRADALKFREWLIDRGLTGSSVTRNFSYLKAVFNFAVSEYALDVTNPFTGVYHDRQAGVIKRQPIPIENIKLVQAQCRQVDDDMRWLVALLSDTGLRLAEGAGLLKSDIQLDCEVPFVRIQKHPWRGLKTRSSERDVPLVGQALWAAERVAQAPSDSVFAFARYNQTDTTAANSASAALNKWLKHYVPAGCTMHSFRHSMRDRLRAVECPAEIIDQIGGWQTDGIGHSYGSGSPISVLQRQLMKIA